MPKTTMVKLREEGVERPEHLAEFNAEGVNHIAEALRKPGVLVPASFVTREAMISSPGVCIDSRALIRLEAIIHIVKC